MSNLCSFPKNKRTFYSGASLSGFPWTQGLNRTSDWRDRFCRLSPCRDGDFDTASIKISIPTSLQKPLF